MTTPTEAPAWKNLYSACSGKLDLSRLQEAFQEWSKTYYDEDNEKMVYNGPHLTAKKLSELMPDKNGKILDVACGTGLVGKQLHSKGHVNIDGVDLVQDMLDRAQETGVYSKLEACDVIGERLPFKDDSYDAIVCIGSFNQGHVTQAVFPELCRVAKKGCIILIIMREAFVYTCPDFMNGQLDMAITLPAQNRTWKYLIRERVQNFIGDLTGLIFAMEVL